MQTSSNMSQIQLVDNGVIIQLSVGSVQFMK